MRNTIWFCLVCIPFAAHLGGNVSAANADENYTEAQMAEIKIAIQQAYAKGQQYGQKAGYGQGYAAANNCANAQLLITANLLGGFDAFNTCTGQWQYKSDFHGNNVLH